MKRIITALLAVFTVFALVSCSGGGSGEKSDPNIIEIGDYVFKYKGCEVIRDEFLDEVFDVIAITYNFTNNSDEPTSFFVSSVYEFEQNGELLDSRTVFVSEDSYETMSDAEMEEVAPGANLDVTLTYALKDTTSPVKATFTGLFSDTSKSHTITLDATANDTNKAEAPVSANGGNADENAENALMLQNTQWYGWWMITDATGDYEDYDGEYFDCCATFEKTNEGYVLMSIWDETYPDYEDECLGEVYFEEIDGMLVSVEGGFFYTGEAVGEGQMLIDPDFSDFEHTLFTYANIEDETGSFVASINLTEWGYEWDEEFNDYPTYYESYFLPLMEEGEGLPADISDIG